MVTDYDGTLKIRAKIVKDGKLYLYEDGKTTKLNYTKDGSYIVFNIDNGSTVYYKAASLNITHIIIISAVSVLTVAGVVVLIIILTKKRKNKVEINNK